MSLNMNLKQIIIIFTIVCIFYGWNSWAAPKIASEPLVQQRLEQVENGDQVKHEDSLFDTIASGGMMMIPIILLGFFGLAILFERAIYYIRSGVYKTSTVREYIKESGQGHFQYSEELEDRLREAVIIYRDNMERGLTLLNGIGGLAPLLGFLGTVIGMIGAFASIAAASTVNAKVVAGGIQVALVTTAGGLTVAVPILAGFHFLNHLVQKVLMEANKHIKEKCSKLPSVIGEA
jgi:biopolymer transport protein ExbB